MCLLVNFNFSSKRILKFSSRVCVIIKNIFDIIKISSVATVNLYDNVLLLSLSMFHDSLMLKYFLITI